MDKIAVLIPCYNEEKTIAKVVKDYKNRVVILFVTFCKNIIDSLVKINKNKQKTVY